LRDHGSGPRGRLKTEAAQAIELAEDHHGEKVDLDGET
jgi:hypothetical protein